MSQQVNLTSEELKGFIKHIVDNNRFLQQQGKKPVAINVEGEAGINSK